MTIESLREAMPPFARDIALNLGTVLTPEGAPDLSVEQIWITALASAYATRDADLIDVILRQASGILMPEAQEAAKAAATIMAMNNVYYRFTHYLGESEIAKMPARLRMNVMSNPGIEKLDFELASLAVSAINGCGKCMESHTHALLKAGASNASIQSAVRIAAVIAASAQAGLITRLSALDPEPMSMD